LLPSQILLVLLAVPFTGGMGMGMGLALALILAL